MSGGALPLPALAGQARWPDTDALADGVEKRERTAIAAALNLLDDRRDPARRAASELVARLAHRVASRGHVVGITGPPGSGKSSLSSVLIGAWRSLSRSVGVLAVDPSSPRSGGALLGDRIRMLRPETDEGVFIRSLASRGELGGLSPEVWPMSLVMLAAFDVVLVETVGIGQSEVDVAELADTTCCVVQPASGDTVQFLKSGVMEVPDVFAVSKSDLGVLAERTARELKGAVPRRPEPEWQVPVSLVSAVTGGGVDELVRAFDSHLASLTSAGALAERRRRQQAGWVVKRLRGEFGTHGIAALGGTDAIVESLVRDAGTAPPESPHGSAENATPLARHESMRQRALLLLRSSGG
jgi:LAO/AO transport system kinase